MKQNQLGRTMLEMLCVLGIIAVLTVATIKAYHYAVVRYRINKTISLVSQVISETRIVHSQQGDYDNLDNCTATTLGIYPKDVQGGCSSDDSSAAASIPYGGNINIITSGKDGSFDVDGDVGAAIVEISGISHDACIGLAGVNWIDGSTGRGATSGIIAVATSRNNRVKDGFITEAGSRIDEITINTSCQYNNHDQNKTVNIACVNGANEENRLPMKPAYATAGCSCGEGLTCQFAVKFY